MEYKDFVKGLVDAETSEDRMALAEENMELFGNVDATKLETLQNTLTATQAQLLERDAIIAEKDKKFKDRFFGNGDSSGNDNNNQHQEPETKSLSELGYGIRKY